MMTKHIEIINPELVLDRNLKLNKPGIMKVYRNVSAKLGPDDEIIRMENGRPVRCVIDPSGAKSLKWTNTAKYNEHWDHIRVRMNKIKEKYKSVGEWKQSIQQHQNLEHMPPGTSDLFDALRIDITRRIMEEMDLVDFVATEIINEEFDNPITAQWLYDYVAPWKTIEGTGDKVNLVYTRLGDKVPIYFLIAGIGFHQDLYNILFNKIFEMQKVNKAVAKFYIMRRNDKVMLPIIDFSYPTGKIVAAATGSGFSVDQLYYDTLVNAIKTIGLLTDFQTKENVDIYAGLTMLTHSTRIFPWLRAISGQLLNGDQVKNLTALTSIVNRIIPYNTKRFKYFKEDVIFKGCDTDYSYLYVSPANSQNANWYLTKRGATHETGPGDTFALTSTKESWYTVDGVFNRDFLGGNEDSPADEEAAGDDTTITQEHGYVIKIANPPDIGNEETET
jgi:hypothetical protein